MKHLAFKITITLFTLVLLFSSCKKDPDIAPVIPTCADGIMNGIETGVDCGGACAPCATCTDGIMNGSEEGVDCGGNCEPCSTTAQLVGIWRTFELNINGEDSTTEFFETYDELFFEFKDNDELIVAISYDESLIDFVDNLLEREINTYAINDDDEIVTTSGGVDDIVDYILLENDTELYLSFTDPDDGTEYEYGLKRVTEDLCQSVICNTNEFCYVGLCFE